MFALGILILWTAIGLGVAIGFGAYTWGVRHPDQVGGFIRGAREMGK